MDLRYLKTISESDDILSLQILLFDKRIFSLLFRKGKKGDKKAKKQESIVKIAAANSKVWEARLDIAETQKKEYR